MSTGRQNEPFVHQIDLQGSDICGTKVKRRKVLIWAIIAAVAAAVAITFVVRTHRWGVGTTRIKGAVIILDDDSRKELPIAEVAVMASDGATSATTESNASGYFNLPFDGGVWPGQTVTLSFRHPDYEPLDIKFQTSLRMSARELWIAKMTPRHEQTGADPGKSSIVVSNIRVRYTVNSPMEVNVGSAVKTFQVVNIGNVPCVRGLPCSPDGSWKASASSETLDAGVGNEFRNVRASCIAGPCPFTRVDSTGFVKGGRNITVSALNWSDTATFLLEAEVLHTAISSSVRESYPVVFGRALSFTLPATEEGVSLEAEVDGTHMVFPLGPALYLSWATCTARTNTEEEKTTVYRCELKPGFRF
jgi:hypothetical protein